MTINKAAYHITLLTIAAGIYLFTYITLAYAETTPPVPARRINLEQIEEKIDTEKEQKKNLQEKLKGIEKELGSTKANLVELTKTIQKQETSLKELEERTASLEQEKLDITIRLEKEHGSIANLLLALQRIRRMPQRL